MRSASTKHCCPNCKHYETSLVYRVSVTFEAIPANLQHCARCDFLYLQNPTWLDIAYRKEFYGDTGYVQRNLTASRFLRLLFLTWELLNRKECPNACDLGTGLGMLPRLMRDYGFSFWGSDLYAKMPLIQPFINPTTPLPLATAFEVVEHIADLPKFLEQHIKGLDLFVFSTHLRKIDEIPSLDWWYYAFGNGQHISFHSPKSLFYAVQEACGSDYKLVHCHGGMHAISNRRGWILALWFSSLVRRFRLVIGFLALLTLAKPKRSLTYTDHIFCMQMNQSANQ